MKSKPTLLVLDLDGTLTKSDNIIQFSRFMILKRRRLRFLLFIPLYVLLVTRIISNVQFKKSYVRFIIKGMSIQFIEKEVKAFISTPQFESDVCQEVLNYGQSADPVSKIIISANFDFLVSQIAHKFHIPLYKSIQLQVYNGIYTGKVTGIIPFGSAKVDSFKSLASEFSGYHTIGIGDSKSDLPLLKYLDEGYIVQQLNGNMIFKVVGV